MCEHACAQDPGASYDVNAHDSDPQPRYDITNENRSVMYRTDVLYTGRLLMCVHHVHSSMLVYTFYSFVN